MQLAVVAASGVAVLVVLALKKLYSRLQLSFAKHPSLRGHARWSRRLARQVAYYEFTGDDYVRSDGAPADIGARRRSALRQLKIHWAAQNPRSQRLLHSLSGSVSDLAFTGSYRVPFPYRAQLPAELKRGVLVEESRGVQIRDVDGNWRYDLSGSYGVNVFGYDLYKDCIAEAVAGAGKLGPVLGAYHPLIVDVVERLKRLSGLDEVSFHMSGIEAVMQAVRLARYHTGRSQLVRFCGAYHGWWDGVQPGVGNERRVDDVYTLRDMSARSLRVLATRRDIACVLVNPLQALHPNADAPSDSTLLTGRRSAQHDRQAYAEWLQALRRVCTQRGIVLIFDEVFTGFRLARGGAQEYFGVQADMVTYGKTLGGGLPVGVLCGSAALMKRFRDAQPANISFARGTFNSHPYVIAAMHAFLRRIDEPACQQIYAQADELWNKRTDAINARLWRAGLPVRIVNLQSVWTVLYLQPGRYHWMFQFYLRQQGLELSWVGSGRMILCLDFPDDTFDIVIERFISAAVRMQDDGWWWESAQLTDRSIRRQLLREMLRARFRVPRWRPALVTARTTDDSHTMEDAQ